MHEVAFDETGNTGADLLRSEQPVFALASVSLSRNEADEIISGIRAAQTREVKFKRLRKSESGRLRIVKVLSSPKLTVDNVIVTIVHKRFMAVAKIVDLLFETVFYRAGADLYKDGANIALSNLLFNSMPVVFGEDWTEMFLCRFVEMIRYRTLKSVQRFYGIVRILCAISKSREYVELLAPILASEQIVEHILANSDKNSLDPAISDFVRHCTVWGERFGEAFDIVHDASKPVFQEKSALESLMSRGEEEHLIGYDRRRFVFPLRAKGIQFGRSEDDPRLQVADLVAGACANWLASFISPGKHQEFCKEIETADVGRFLINAIWPTGDIYPQELGTEYTGGINAPDHIAEFLRRHRS